FEYSGAGNVAPAPVRSAPVDVLATAPAELAVSVFDVSDLQPKTPTAATARTAVQLRTRHLDESTAGPNCRTTASLCRTSPRSSPRSATVSVRSCNGRVTAPAERENRTRSRGR